MGQCEPTPEDYADQAWQKMWRVDTVLTLLPELVTPDDMVVIKAMIAGEWRCENCKASACMGDAQRPCIGWQPGEE